jgi:hypothetical protein
MIPYHYIEADFFKTRSTRIGASDAPALIQDPLHPNKSLAGYDRTPTTVYLEKTGQKKRDFVGFQAEMGHFLETKTLERFIRDIFGYQAGREFRHKKEEYEYLSEMHPGKYSPRDFQVPLFKHNTQYFTEDMITHPDMIYHPTPEIMSGETTLKDPNGNPYEKGKAIVGGITINLRKPFLVEAKSHGYWPFKNDYKKKELDWHGIPWREYIQVQFQLKMFQVDVAYLALTYDTNQYQMWEVKANRDHQALIMKAADYVAKCIKDRRPPKDMILNAQDVKEIYPETDGDYSYLEGDELEQAKKIAKEYRKADGNIKLWTERKKEAVDAMSVMLKDRDLLKDDEGNNIAGWTKGKKGYEKVKSLTEIKKMDGKIYRYLAKNDALTTTADGKSTVAIKWRE